MGQHFTFCRFSRKRKLFRNFDCDFRKRFTKGFFPTEYEEFRNFHLTASSRYLQTAALKEEDALFEAGEFYDSNPVALQRAVGWFLSLKFGFRAREEIWKLRCGDVQLRPQNDGQEGLVWLAELGTNTRHGQERGHQRAFQPKILPPILRDVPSVFTGKTSAVTSQWK